MTESSQDRRVQGTSSLGQGPEGTQIVSGSMEVDFSFDDLERVQHHEQLLGCVRGDWRSLVVLPAQPGVSAYAVADALVSTSNQVRAVRATLLPAERVEPARVSQVIVEMIDRVHAGGVVVAVVGSVLEHPETMPLLMAADAVLLCVYLGRTGIDEARRTVELVGRERFLGAVTVAPPAAPSRRAPRRR